MDSKYSVVEYFNECAGETCGYCKSSHSNYNTGLWAHTMTVEDYQALIDRGWRRSGQYCYKPSLSITCCPLYTIKCDALNIKLSKSQKKLLKRVTRYLNEGHKTNCTENNDDDSDTGSDANPSGGDMYDKRMNKILEEKSVNEVPIVSEIVHDSEQTANSKETAENRLISGSNEPSKSDSLQNKDKCEPQAVELVDKKALKNPRPGEGKDESKPECKKAKLLRLEKKKKKLAEKGISSEISNKKQIPQEKSLEDYIQESKIANPVNKLELRLVRSSPRSQEFEETFLVEHALYQKYQMAIHKDPVTKVTEHQFNRFLVTSPLKIRLVPSVCEKDLLKESWKLFVKYQTAIHKEKEADCDYRTFHSFLVASPLQSKNAKKAPSCGYGSFHQQYWLNGKLIAVGVIDILPKCISSVYFFYDPEYSFLSLGTYGSLRELELVRSLQKEVPEIAEYYMGYYIHTCPKMRYKARYTPSYLLCPEAYTWHPIAECQAKLDKAKYSRFNDDLDAVCEDSFININKVMVLFRQIAMPYSSFKLRTNNIDFNDDEEVTQYAQLVGRTCAERMLLYRS